MICKIVLLVSHFIAKPYLKGDTLGILSSFAKQFRRIQIGPETDEFHWCGILLST